MKAMRGIMLKNFLGLFLLMSTSLWAGSGKGNHKVVYPTNGWKSVRPLKENIDSTYLVRADSEIIKNQPAVRGILLSRHGKIVFEKYYSSFNADSLYNTWSITKSVISMLVGIALQRNDVDSLQEKAFLHLPPYPNTAINDNCKVITLAQLMTMTSGLSWYKPGTNIVMRRYDEMDQIFASPTSNAPGATFRYDGANAHAVAITLQYRLGKPLEDYAAAHLFKPLGIEKFRWEKDQSGYNLGSEGLYLNARDLAKLGYLMLRKGKWEGKQLISQEYYCMATTQQNPGGFPGYDAYGLFWWVSKTANYETFYALGSGGLILAVTPSLGLVAVIITDPNHPQADLYKPRQLYLDYLLPAAK